MDWFKLSTKLPRDPKWKRLSPSAKAAYIEAICEVAEQETDGIFHAPHSRIGADWVAVGLAEEVVEGYRFPAYLKWNPSHADVVARRTAGRKAARSRWGTGEPNANRIAPPNTEVEVEVEVEKDAKHTPAASSNNNPFQPTDRQMLFADRLGITVPQVVKLNREYGIAAALSAMEQLHGFPPDEPVQNPYGWLRTVASFKAVAS